MLARSLAACIALGSTALHRGAHGKFVSVPSEEAQEAAAAAGPYYLLKPSSFA
eukprot:COSAG02_NODE_36598_length_452_cov_11.371105_1_plen_52_part_10